MDDSLLKLEVENLRELLRLKDLNNELLEVNYNFMNRLIQEYRKERKTIPVEIEAMLGKIKQILQEIQFADQPIFYSSFFNRRFDRTR